MRSVLFRRALRLLLCQAGLWLAGGGPVRATDRALLDLLVSKGILTQDEAAAGAKNLAAPVVVAAPARGAPVIKIEGALQIEYNYLALEDQAPDVPNPPAASRFLVRRARLGFLADLGNGWGAEVLFEFAGGPDVSAPPQSVPTGDKFDKAFIAKDIPGYGLAAAGYQKVQFGQEENTSSSVLKTIDRSMMTRYFSSRYRGPTQGDLGFNSQHVGLFWLGRLGADRGFGYGAALTNGIQSATAFGNAGPGAPAFNQFGFWGNVSYEGAVGGWQYKAGVNLGYTGEGNSVATQSNAIWGYNPYLALHCGGFTLTAEFIQAGVQNGRANVFGDTSAAWPYGFNVSPSYRLNEHWEVVWRFSYLATNGRGMVPNQVVRGAPNPATGGAFDDGWSVYFGVNYYLLGNSLKLTAGYEFFRFNDRSVLGVPGQAFSGPSANVDAFRTALQMSF